MVSSPFIKPFALRQGVVFVGANLAKTAGLPGWAKMRGSLGACRFIDCTEKSFMLIRPEIFRCIRHRPLVAQQIAETWFAQRGRSIPGHRPRFDDLV
jgi:hypothetical protein